MLAAACEMASKLLAPTAATISCTANQVSAHVLLLVVRHHWQERNRHARIYRVEHARGRRCRLAREPALPELGLDRRDIR